MQPHRCSRCGAIVTSRFCGDCGLEVVEKVEPQPVLSRAEDKLSKRRRVNIIILAMGVAGILLISMLSNSISSRPTSMQARAQPPISGAAPTAVLAIPTATPPPTAVQPPTPEPTAPPAAFEVSNTNGQGVYLRREPAGEKLTAWPEKTVMLIVGEAQDIQGEKWSNVQSPDGSVGWVPFQYLDVPPRPTLTPAPVPTKDRSRYQLELLAASGETGNYGFAIVEGQVKNIGSLPLKNVAAVVQWYTSSATFITSDTTLIEYNPILPGQTSPFKVMSRSNPAMDKYSVGFKDLLGPSIMTLDERKK